VPCVGCLFRSASIPSVQISHVRIHGTASSFRRNALDFSDVIRYHGANLANSTTMMQPRLRVPVLTALCDNPDATAAELTECLSRTAGERVTNEGAQMPWTIDVVRGCLYSLHRKAYVSTTGQRRGRSANLLYRVTEKGQAYLVAKSPTALQEVAVMPTPDEEWQREVDSAYINLVIGELQAWSPSEDDVAINLEDARETLAQGAERGIQPTPGFLELILPETVAAYRERKRKAHEHAARIGLDRLVHEVSDTGELDDRVHLAGDAPSLFPRRW